MREMNQTKRIALTWSRAVKKKIIVVMSDWHWSLVEYFPVFALTVEDLHCSPQFVIPLKFEA
jgi:hypothetical protein